MGCFFLILTKRLWWNTRFLASTNHQDVFPRKNGTSCWFWPKRTWSTSSCCPQIGIRILSCPSNACIDLFFFSPNMTWIFTEHEMLHWFWPKSWCISNEHEISCLFWPGVFLFSSCPDDCDPKPYGFSWNTRCLSDFPTTNQILSPQKLLSRPYKSDIFLLEMRSSASWPKIRQILMNHEISSHYL